MIEFISFLLLNIILARILSKKLRIAGMVHAIVFVVIAFLYMFTLDNDFIRGHLTKVVGEANYYLLNDSLVYKLQANNISISSVLVIEESTFAASCILFLLFFVKYIKKIIDELKLHYQLPLEVKESEEVYAFIKKLLPRKKIYLENCSLRI